MFDFFEKNLQVNSINKSILTNLTKIIISSKAMELSGNVPNRLLITSAKFYDLSKNRKSYVKISILGPFFGTPGIKL